MRKELEFPQIDEGKLETVMKIINYIVDKGSGNCSRELAELSKITGKEHNEMEFAEYWGWTDLDNLAMTAMTPEPPCIKGLERSEIIILITMIKDSFESGEDNKVDYYIELLNKSLPLSNVIDYIMSGDSIEEIVDKMAKAVSNSVITL